ncbi:MAG: cation:dicarboxylate symporter family transporter [[Clostridium] scindens]
MIQRLIVNLGPLKVFTGLNPIKFVKNFFPVIALAFATATSNATISAVH